MRSRLIVLFIFTALFIFSCVPNKKLVYLQNDDLHEDMPKDSILRSYELNYDNYKVQPHDILSVQFNSITDEEFDVLKDLGMNSTGGNGGGNLLALRGELVDLEGNIMFPLVGKVNVAGLTVFQIQDKLQNIADEIVEEPVVKVRLLNYRVSVLGEVNGESVVPISNTRTTFMEAVAMAGGLTEMADRTNVKVIRQKGDKAVVFYVNLLEEDFISSDKFYVYQNDIIVVPPLPQRPFRKYYTQNLSLVLSSISAILFISSLITFN